MATPSPDAIAANDAGVALADARQFAEAIPLYERALALAPDWHAPHLNLGIGYKHSRDWARSLEESLKAIELDEEKAGAGAFWNVGVAATALGDWKRARWAWIRAGIKLPEGEGPIDMNIGATPIRVSCEDQPEVVWCHRIDPARARIESIPTPETGRRCGDLLLHDGEPRGKREFRGKLVSVFDELAVLERSALRTWRVEVNANTSDELEELFEAVHGIGAVMEDWTSSLRILCKQCSEGVPHEHHPVETERSPPWKPERTVAIATADGAVFRLLERWAGVNGRSASSPVLLTP